MANLRIERVNALPETLTASTLYIVKSAEDGLAEIVLTGNTASDVRHILNKSEVTSLITSAVSGFNNIEISSTIATRDSSFGSSTRNVLVLVLDATGDTTVKSGAALYIFDATGKSWFKVSEFESLDVVLDWNALQNKPTSSVAAIDAAVAKAHDHANKALLDTLGTNDDGLTVGGANIQAFIANAAW